MSTPATTHHIQVLMLIQIVDLEKILRLESVRLATLQKHLQVLPLQT